MPASTPRTRLIFAQMNVYAGPAAQSGNGATGHLAVFDGVPANSGSSLISELANIQSCNLSLGIDRQDLNVFGRQARVGAIQIRPASISMDTSWNATNAQNEYILGFNHKGGSFLSGILTKASDSKNYFITVSQQGVDDDGVTDPNKRDLWMVGNGFVSNYSFEASVGGVATTSVTVEGMNIATATGTTGIQSPAVNPANSSRISTWNFWVPPAQVATGANNVFALKPGDIELSFPTNAGFLVPLSGNNKIHVQSFSVNVPISRQTIDALGSNWGISREPQTPITSTLNLRALATEVNPNSYDSLVCDDRMWDFGILLRQPSCNGTGAPAIRLAFNQAQLTNLSFGNTIGGDSTIDLTFVSQQGGSQSNDGLTVSGYY